MGHGRGKKNTCVPFHTHKQEAQVGPERGPTKTRDDRVIVTLSCTCPAWDRSSQKHHQTQSVDQNIDVIRTEGLFILIYVSIMLGLIKKTVGTLDTHTPHAQTLFKIEIYHAQSICCEYLNNTTLKLVLYLEKITELEPFLCWLILIIRGSHSVITPCELY